MARIAGVNIPTNKRVVIALQYIHGIGSKFAQEIVDKGNQLGMNNYLKKPFSSADLKACIERVVGPL